MKFVTLMNPRPRRAARRVRASRMRRNRLGRFTRRSSGGSHRRRRRRVHSNPQPRVVYRTRTRRVTRYRTRRVTAIAHRNPSTSPAVRRKISLAVRRSMRARRSPMYRIRRRFSRRSGGSGGGFGGGSLISSFKSAFSKPMLMKAGGAVGASLAVGFVLNKWGDKLPLANHKYGRFAYTLGVPVLAAYLVRKKNRDLAEGLVIGGLVMTINAIMQQVRPQTATIATVAPTTTGNLGSYAVAGELGGFSYYPGGTADQAGLGGSNVAFAGSAWG